LTATIAGLLSTAASRRCSSSFKLLRGVEHDEHERRIGEGFAAAMNSEQLDFSILAWGTFAQARGVDELDGKCAMEMRSVTRSRVVPGVAVTMARSRSTRRLKTSFCRRWAADDGEGEAVVHDAAASKGDFKRGERRGKLGDAPGNFLLRRDVEIVLGEVDAGFKQSDKFDEGFFHRRDAMAERTAIWLAAWRAW